MCELDLADQLVAADALEQVTGRTHSQRLEQVLLVVVHRQHHDLAVWIALAQGSAQVETAEALHPHIAQHDVGVAFGDHIQRPLGADGLADHLHPVGERGKHGLETLDHHLVVID